MVVQAPSVDASFRVYEEGAHVRAEDVHGVLGTNGFDIHGLLVLAARLEATAYLARLCAAPAEDLLVFGQSKRVVFTADNLDQRVLAPGILSEFRGQPNWRANCA